MINPFDKGYLRLKRVLSQLLGREYLLSIQNASGKTCIGSHHCLLEQKSSSDYGNVSDFLRYQGGCYLEISPYSPNEAGTKMTLF